MKIKVDENVFVSLQIQAVVRQTTTPHRTGDKLNESIAVYAVDGLNIIPTFCINGDFATPPLDTLKGNGSFSGALVAALTFALRDAKKALVVEGREPNPEEIPRGQTN